MTLFKQFPSPGPTPTRIAHSRLGSPQGQTLIFEYEFENLGDCEEQWTDWMDNQGGREFMDRWFEVCERNSGIVEVWGIIK